MKDPLLKKLALISVKLKDAGLEIVQADEVKTDDELVGRLRLLAVQMLTETMTQDELAQVASYWITSKTIEAIDTYNTLREIVASHIRKDEPSQN